MMKVLFSGKRYIITIIFALFLMNISGGLHAAQQDTFKYEFFAFNNISAELGRKYLADAQVGEVSRLPDSPTVLVTSTTPGNMQKAKIIKDLIDSKEEYAVRIIPSTAKQLPSGNQIMDSIGTIAIGSFSNPPAAEGHARTIVDICNDNVIIIAPSRMIDRVINTINKLQNTNTQDIFGRSQFVKSNQTKSDSEIKNQELNITPSLLAENVSKNNQYKEILNQRITESSPVITNTSSQTEPVKSNLLAANQLIDSLGIPNPEQEITLTLSDQLTLIEFIGLVGPTLKMDFMYNASDFAGKDVTINPNGVLKGRIKIKDLYNYLDAVLQFKGFVMTRVAGNLVTIVPKERAHEINPMFIQADQAQVEAGDLVVIDTFELKYISTTAAEELIRKMGLSIQITAIPENKKLMITEYATRMPRIRALLDIVDRPGEPKQFRYRQLQYTYAQTLAPKIQSLAEKLGTISITITTSSTPTLPERPEKRPTESDAAFTVRLRTYDNEVRRISAAAAGGAPTAPAQSGESTAPIVFLDSDARTNRILMIGLAKQLDEVEDLVDTLDVSQRDPRKLHVYKIEYLGAEEVINKLQDLNIIPKTQDSADSSRTKTAQTSRITGDAAPREPVITPSAPGTSKGSSDTLESVGEEPLVVLVESINSLLVNATEEQHALISSIIALVDKEREEIPFKIYQLKNTDPEHVMSILEPLITEKVRGPEDKIVSEIPKQDELITIVADPNTSSLIVNANPRNQNWIESLIRVLDKRRPQVLIDVTLVQISKNDIFNYDLNMISSIPDLTHTSGLTSAILPGISSGASNLVQPMANSSRGHYIDFQSNGGQGTGFYGDKHINTLLTLMEQKDYGRVMAKPKILVNDNQKGTISTTDKTYVVKQTGTVIEGVSSTVQTQIDYEGYDAGITLQITPHISESDLLRLDIDLERSDFGTITGDKPPDTTVSKVGTIVTVPDGSTIILGGMLKMNQSRGGTQVPLLSRIPLIGTLFKSVNNSDIQRNLYVFVKAEIIRPPDEDNAGQVELERISKANREAFEKHESQFQNYQSFPGIKPTPMEPVNVLDAQ
ncbi:MAG: hypothetical protein JW787_04460 [Sedimentisphaerales bacterium]|nr:hypothetical protein [Sedimentisphaerales bacterium]